ncbi:uncharacterized protein V6R79_009087 [Siganus canaliculatus]
MELSGSSEALVSSVADGGRLLSLIKRQKRSASKQIEAFVDLAYTPALKAAGCRQKQTIRSICVRYIQGADDLSEESHFSSSISVAWESRHCHIYESLNAALLHRHVHKQPTERFSVNIQTIKTATKVRILNLPLTLTVNQFHTTHFLRSPPPADGQLRHVGPGRRRQFNDL